jgi:hypothetical protein
MISAQASMLLLGLDIDEYSHVSSVIVHPSTVLLRGQHPTGSGTFSSAPRYILGQAHYRGPVVLSWYVTERYAEITCNSTPSRAAESLIARQAAAAPGNKR